MIWQQMRLAKIINIVKVKKLFLKKKKNCLKRFADNFYDNYTLYLAGFLKTGLAKISTHSTTWQFKTTKLIQRPIKSLYLTPDSKFQRVQI